jgi:phosphoenolpyruvate carboxykinase (ATP)
LENVTFDAWTREVDFKDNHITENTRCAYPIENIPHARIPCIAGHPKNIIMLTCDAFGVIPPVSKLTPSQSMYHFISGYTAKIGGTEDGITEPTATFSACFGQPFLVWHPTKYAGMLAERIHRHAADAWLINTGWVGGKYGGDGQRCPLKYTRAIIDAIHSGELAKADFELYPVFNLHVPKKCFGVPSEILYPERSWVDKEAFFAERERVAKLFIANFEIYREKASTETHSAGPQIL